MKAIFAIVVLLSAVSEGAANADTWSTGTVTETPTTQAPGLVLKNVGEACGFGVGSCAMGLHCAPQSDGSTVCASPNSPSCFGPAFDSDVCETMKMQAMCETNECCRWVMEEPFEGECERMKRQKSPQECEDYLTLEMCNAALYCSWMVDKGKPECTLFKHEELEMCATFMDCEEGESCVNNICSFTGVVIRGNTAGTTAAASANDATVTTTAAAVTGNSGTTAAAVTGSSGTTAAPIFHVKCEDYQAVACNEAPGCVWYREEAGDEAECIEYNEVECDMRVTSAGCAAATSCQWVMDEGEGVCVDMEHYPAGMATPDPTLKKTHDDEATTDSVGDYAGVIAGGMGLGICFGWLLSRGKKAAREDGDRYDIMMDKEV